MTSPRLIALAALALSCASEGPPPEPLPVSRRGDRLWVSPPSASIGAREHHSAVLLGDGKVLVTAGYDTGGLASTMIFDPATFSIRAVGPLAQARWYQSAVMQRSGKPMVIAGKIPGAPNSTFTTETFDPVTETWSSGPSLSSRRERQSATVLLDGRVLVVGDFGGQDPTNELLPADGGPWQVLPGAMRAPRSSHSSVLLDDGRVLVLGGYNSSPPRDLNDAEIFDPSNFSWRDAGVFGTGRRSVVAVRGFDGRVTAAAGADQSGPDTPLAELNTWPGSDGGWQLGAPLSATRSGASLSLLADGRVMIAGGAGNSSNSADFIWLDGGRTNELMPGSIWGHVAVTLANGEIALLGGSDQGGNTGKVFVYNGAVSAWSPAAPIPQAQSAHTATLLPDGTVLVVGQGAFRYLPATDTWVDAGAGVARAEHSATLLLDGRVLVVGQGTRVDLYQPASGVWSGGLPMPSARQGHSATLLSNGRVLVAGGTVDGNFANALDTALVFDPAVPSWTPTSPMALARAGHLATALRDGTVFIAGGTPASSPAEVFDSTALTFGTRTAPSGARRNSAGGILPTGRVYLAGGCCPRVATIELYDPLTNTWLIGGNLGAPASHQATAILHSGRVLLAGGHDGGTPISTTAIYDPRLAALVTPLGTVAARSGPTATRLLDGRVLLVGGEAVGSGPSASADLFEEWSGLFARPSLDPLGNVPAPGTPFTVTGSGWITRPEGTNGDHMSSASNYPLLQLERADTGELRWATLTNWTDTTATAVFPAGLRKGWWVARIIVGGVPSVGRVVVIGAPSTDGGSASDGGSGIDGGPLADGGSASDGGVQADGGVELDGGLLPDGGLPGSDGGAIETDGGTTSFEPRDFRVGCGCGAGRSEALMALALLLLARRRVR